MKILGFLISVFACFSPDTYGMNVQEMLGYEVAIHRSVEPVNDWYVSRACDGYDSQSLKTFHENHQPDTAFWRIRRSNNEFIDHQINIGQNLSLHQAIVHIRARDSVIDVSDELIRKTDSVMNYPTLTNNQWRLGVLTAALQTPLNIPFCTCWQPSLSTDDK